MKKRIATILCMFLALGFQMSYGKIKFKSALIDSLHNDVESHIYDKDVTKRIDKLMQASKDPSEFL